MNRRKKLYRQVRELLDLGMPLNIVAKVLKIPRSQIVHLADKSFTSV
ncbi:hypothetical protein [Fangia hongkongensis]|nr:hypothetical protein [Fangia hongkongensis]MBK2125417.1 hypothetical protein [Fangia hongkongensis]